jgi:hypothetical protein
MSREISVRLADGHEAWSVDYSKLSVVFVRVESSQTSVRECINSAIGALIHQNAAPSDFWKNPFAIALGGENQSPSNPDRALALENSFGVRADGSAYALNIGFDELTFADLDRAVEAGLARGDSNEFVFVPAQRGAAGGEEILQFLSAVGVTFVVEAFTEIGRTSIRRLWLGYKHRLAIRKIRKMMKSFEQNGISDPFLVEHLISLSKIPTTKRIQQAFQLPRGITEDILFRSGRVQNRSNGVWELIEIPEALELREKWLRSIYKTNNKHTQG